MISFEWNLKQREPDQFLPNVVTLFVCAYSEETLGLRSTASNVEEEGSISDIWTHICQVAQSHRPPTQLPGYRPKIRATHHVFRHKMSKQRLKTPSSRLEIALVGGKYLGTFQPHTTSGREPSDRRSCQHPSPRISVTVSIINKALVSPGEVCRRTDVNSSIFLS